MARIQPKREPVANVPGFYVTKRVSGNVYEFRLDGRWIRVPGSPSQNEAKQWRNKYLGLEEHERVKTTKRTFFEYATEYIDGAPQLKETSRRLYREQLRTHLAPLHKLRLHEIDKDQVQRIIRRMTSDGRAGNTVLNALTTLGSILTAAVDDGVIMVNPVSQLGKRDRPRQTSARKRILQPEEAAKLVRVTDDHFKAFTGLLLFGGLRISEALGLTWGDVDFRTNTVRVWRQLAHKQEDVTIGEHWASLKGREGEIKDRNVEVSTLLRQLLIAHRGDRIVHPDDFLFPGKSGGPLHKRTAQHRFNRAVERAGLDNEPHLTPHQCRHNFASALIAAGADVGFVSDQLGHDNPNVTLGIYRHEFTAARAAGSGAAAIDAIYGAAMASL